MGILQPAVNIMLATVQPREFCNVSIYYSDVNLNPETEPK